MNRHQRRAHWARDGWAPLERATIIPPSQAQIDALIAHARAIAPDADPDMLRQRIFEESQNETWRNAKYVVQVKRFERAGPNGCAIVQLSIRRSDRGPARDWRDFQRIKNQLVGVECEAVELYPAESRVVDTANQFHLWCVEDPTFRWPVGYNDGRIISNDKHVGGSVQRPREE